MAFLGKKFLKAFDGMEGMFKGLIMLTCGYAVCVQSHFKVIRESVER